MITNTCLTGGSFELEPPGAGAEDPLLPPPPPPPPELDGEEDLPEPDLAPAEAGVEEAPADEVDSEAAEGVGSDPAEAEGGSLVEGEEASGIGVAAVGAAGGRTSLTCLPEDAASVSCTEEPATSPMRTPKPRNISTSTAETREEGSEGSVSRPGRRPARREPAGGAVSAESPPATPQAPMSDRLS